MKNIICLYIAILFAGVATAQRNPETQSQYRTDISVKDQLKGNAMPNAQYRTPGTKPATGSAGHKQQQQSIGAQIKNNTEPGKVYKKTSSKGETAPATASRPTLTSDKKAEPLKQQPVPEMPKNVTQ